MSPEFIDALKQLLPAENLITDQDMLRAYECDGLTAHRTVPMAVALPAPDCGG